MSIESRIAQLSKDQKDSILHDLFYCLEQGRLLDAVDGWEKTKKNNFRPKAFGVRADNRPVKGSAPNWNSLGAMRNL